MNKSRVFIAMLTCLLSVGLASTQAKAQFQPGDVIIATVDPGAFPLQSTGRLLWYDSAGHLKRELISVQDGVLEGAAFSPTGVLHVALGGGISKVGPDGTTSPFSSALGPNEYFGRLSFARDASVYTGTGSLGHALMHVSSAGTHLEHYDIANSPRGVDLGSDQCTLYYVSLQPTVGRFDVCHGIPLSGVGSLFGLDLRVLSEGSLLIGRGDEILQLSQAGTVTRTYAVPGSRLALDSDRHSAWFSDGGQFSKLDLVTGNITQGPFSTGAQSIVAMTVYGEPRAALTDGPLAAVPTLSFPLLAALGALLVTTAFFRLRP